MRHTMPAVDCSEQHVLYVDRMMAFESRSVRVHSDFLLLGYAESTVLVVQPHHPNVMC